MPNGTIIVNWPLADLLGGSAGYSQYPSKWFMAPAIIYYSPAIFRLNVQFIYPAMIRHVQNTHQQHSVLKISILGNIKIEADYGNQPVA
jgi:hypothetical protein